MKDLSKHPCFNGEARNRFGRIHLPVAPRCNIQCRYCNRKFDCMHEGHPGAASVVLTPSQSLDYLQAAVHRRPELSAVGLAGPGDPFANPEETMETLRLVRREFPDLLLCVATNGLAVGAHIEELAALAVSHVTLTVNAVDPEIGAALYAWVRDGRRVLRGFAAAELLWERQREAIRRLKSFGIIVKINSIVIPGINQRHIPFVAESVASLGADLFNVMPMVPVQGAEFGTLPPPHASMVEYIKTYSKKFLPQMEHCARCRADAAGLITESLGESSSELLRWKEAHDLDGQTTRPFVAVASFEGMLVNQHLGEAAQFRIFQKQTESANGYAFREYRTAPAKGGGDERWHALAEILHDCRAVLVASAGPQPQKILKEHGLRIIEMDGLIEEGLAAIYANNPMPRKLPRRLEGCMQGQGCRGTGMGCG